MVERDHHRFKNGFVFNKLASQNTLVSQWRKETEEKDAHVILIIELYPNNHYSHIMFRPRPKEQDQD